MHTNGRPQSITLLWNSTGLVRRRVHVASLGQPIESAPALHLRIRRIQYKHRIYIFSRIIIRQTSLQLEQGQIAVSPLSTITMPR